jgi:peptidoglycan hydrolase-like protein with peptidoglycan-binding domain
LKKLRYLIAKDVDPGTDDSITVIGYEATTPPKNGAKYINLRDEYDAGTYGPYLPSDDIDDQYNEPAPDPAHRGFWDNLETQLDRAKAQGFTSVELDNCDTYTASVVLLAYNAVASRGLTVWAKNPALVDGNREAILAHSAVVGVIVEKDCGTPATYDAMRRAVGKPDLPIRFVSYGGGKQWAQQTAQQIKDNYQNMGVTHSSNGEYGSSEDVLLPKETIMAWRVAKSLLKLREQVDAKWPGRDKSSDGTIGDAAHQATTSDHNPNSAGVVTAMDITHDPAHGLDARKLAEALVASRDPRIKYIISNAQIVSSQVSPWQWRSYTGANAHRAHVHISVDASLYDDDREWNLGAEAGPITADNAPILERGDSGDAVRELQRRIGVTVDGEFGETTEAALKAFQLARGLDGDGIAGPKTWAALFSTTTEPVGKRQTRITATVWNDAMGAYGPIDHSRPSVSLPAPFPKDALPVIRVYGPKGSADGKITDKGPWYDGTSARPADRYWETGQRPRAESDSKTNGAGIDLNPAMARAVGIDGKGLVDWEFVKDVVKPPPVDEEPKPVPTPTPAKTIQEVLAQIEVERKAALARIDAMSTLVKQAVEFANKPAPLQSGADLLSAVPEWVVPLAWPYIQQMSGDQVLALLKTYKSASKSATSGANTAIIAGSAAAGGLGLGAFIIQILQHFAGG